MAMVPLQSANFSRSAPRYPSARRAVRREGRAGSVTASDFSRLGHGVARHSPSSQNKQDKRGLALTQCLLWRPPPLFPMDQVVRPNQSAQGFPGGWEGRRLVRVPRVGVRGVGGRDSGDLRIGGDQLHVAAP